MTTANSNHSDQKNPQDNNQLSAEESLSPTAGVVELPEEARVILARLESRPENDVMNTEALRLVRILWPEAFNVSHPRPLKIGIHKDMAEGGLLPENIISIALRFFTTMERYLEIIKSGATRINLQGKAAGRVKLREAVDAEIKLYTQSSDFITTRDRVIIKQIRVLAVKKQSS
ncbi:ProQ/FINO family protein [Endozoicomonas ascidiicola]|uniref:ProQ/FINO family protein n=1 Tax=Endozoicomonas ascidiicola TaxID=1698521 RepID=UPI00082ED1C6|nr:ProQ/FINO family protein [Endozoicomonas ascidiicola]